MAFPNGTGVRLHVKMVPYRDAAARPYLDPAWRDHLAALTADGYYVDVIEPGIAVTAGRPRPGVRRRVDVDCVRRSTPDPALACRGAPRGHASRRVPSHRTTERDRDPRGSIALTRGECTRRARYRSFRADVDVSVGARRGARVLAGSVKERCEHHRGFRWRIGHS